MKKIIVEYSDQYKKARAPDILSSGWTCTGIAVGAIYGKRGYRFHDIGVGRCFGEEAELLFRDLRRDVKDLNRLQMHIIGGEIEPNDEFEEYVRQARESILRKIDKSKFRKSLKNVNWCPAEHLQKLDLILSQERAEIRTEPVEVNR